MDSKDYQIDESDKKYDDLRGIDVEDEFRLIMERKSKLSRRLRDLVMDKKGYDRCGR